MSQRPDLTFRVIAPDDPLISEVDELRHEALFAPFGLPRNDRWDDTGSDRIGIVGLLRGRVVGYASIVFDSEGDVGHVRQVCVRPDLQRSGVGSAVMREVEAEAMRRGLEWLWLHARTTAEPFYKRLGWTTVSGIFPSGRTQMPHVRMEKSL